MKKKRVVDTIGIEKAERLKKAIDYLIYYGKIKDVRELSDKKIIAYTNISKAKNGDLKYLTASMFERLCNEYKDFNIDFFLSGNGEMLKSEGQVNVKGVNNVVGNNNINVNSGDVVSKNGNANLGATESDRVKELTNMLKTAQEQINKLLEHQEKLLSKL